MHAMFALACLGGMHRYQGALYWFFTAAMSANAYASGLNIRNYFKASGSDRP